MNLHLKIIPIVVSICLLFTACGVNQDPGSTIADPNQPPASSSVNEDNNYTYNRALLNYADRYETPYQTGVLDLPLVHGMRPMVTAIDDHLNLYTLASSSALTSNSQTLFCELGMYDLNRNAYTPLVTLDNGVSLGFISAVSSQYLVWVESLDGTDWGKTQLHLLDKATQQDQVIYVHAVNPETGRIYSINSNPAVILGEEIYFDDMTGIVNGQYQMDVLKYDIATGSIETAAPMAKHPVKYKNGIAYLKKAADSDDSVLYTYLNGKESKLNLSGEIRLNEDIADFTLTDGPVFLSKRNLEDENADNVGKRGTLSTGIYMDGNDAPIVEGKLGNYTYAVRANGKWMAWEVTNPEKPVYYDILNDQFIRLNDEAEEYYANFVTQDALLFLAHSIPYDETSPLKYILIR
jgi:hypothetical protein